MPHLQPVISISLSHIFYSIVLFPYFVQALRGSQLERLPIVTGGNERGKGPGHDRPPSAHYVIALHAAALIYRPTISIMPRISELNRGQAKVYKYNKESS
jgi:hypothetical protein